MSGLDSINSLIKFLETNKIKTRLVPVISSLVTAVEAVFRNHKYKI